MPGQKYTLYGNHECIGPFSMHQLLSQDFNSDEHYLSLIWLPMVIVVRGRRDQWEQLGWPAAGEELKVLVESNNKINA